LTSHYERDLVVFLVADRLRLRRTLATLRGLYGGSVWKLSGNVLEERYWLISRQFESMRTLQNTLGEGTVNTPLGVQRKQRALNQLIQCEQQAASLSDGTSTCSLTTFTIPRSFTKSGQLLTFRPCLPPPPVAS
jgi:hypothetical protein